MKGKQLRLGLNLDHRVYFLSPTPNSHAVDFTDSYDTKISEYNRLGL